MRFKRLICAAVVATGAHLAIAASAASAASVPSVASAVTLAGAGSTLVAPLVADWAQGFDNSTGNDATYDPLGSAAGVSDASSATVDFGAADVPLSVYSNECGGCREIPWALSALGIGYNLPGISDSPDSGVKNALKLTGAILAKIYLGQIRTWNNKAIVELNKGLDLPNLKITPVWHADASAETYVFTQFLSDVSGAWSSSRGYATTSSFVAGIGEIGDPGVAAAVARTPGAIGYVNEQDLLAHHLAAAAVQNAAGNYEHPQSTSVGGAAAAVTSFSSSGVSIVDPPKSAKTAYPISAFTYAVIPAKVKDLAMLEGFLTYAVTSGRDFGIGLGFAPIPAGVESYDENVINSL